MRSSNSGFAIVDRLFTPDSLRPVVAAIEAGLATRSKAGARHILGLPAVRELASDPKLDGYSGSVADSGEGRWTIEAAMEQSVPVPVLSNSLFARFRSRQQSTYGDKMLSAMRFGFGGHVETPKK